MLYLLVHTFLTHMLCYIYWYPHAKLKCYAISNGTHTRNSNVMLYLLVDTLLTHMLCYIYWYTHS